MIDVARLGDAEYVEGVYRTRQLRDAAAYGLGVAQREEGPTGELLDDASRMQADLSEYLRGAWSVIEPAKRFMPNWHIDAISEHLQAVTTGDITRLLINIPPGSMKSLSVSVFWMTWEWIRRPSTRWLFLTHSVDLCTRDSVKCRRLILSPWYQERWGHLFQLAPDQRTKVNFENNRSGSRLAKTMTGSRGQGGERTVVDDPHSTTMVESDVMRKDTLRHWDEEISTRLRDMRTGAVVVMMQRLHQHDLTGHILDLAEEGHWEHLMLPMRYEYKRRCVTRLGFEDPRTEEGEWLWPDYFPPDSPAVRELERTLGPYGVAGQWQQDPVAREGGQFERDWFNTKYDDVPKGSHMLWVRHWDMAGTEDGGAYTVGLLMGVNVRDGTVWITDVVRGQWDAGDRNDRILETAEADALYAVDVSIPPRTNGEIKPNKLLVIQHAEQEPGSGGKDQARNFVRLLAGYRAKTDPSSGKKFIRADPFAGAAKNGDVRVLAGKPWTKSYLDEMEAAGPGAAYLDQMDASSAAYNLLMELYDARRVSSMTGLRLDVLEDGLQQRPAWKID